MVAAVLLGVINGPSNELIYQCIFGTAVQRINKVRGSLSEQAARHSSSSERERVIDMVNASATGGHC